MTVDVYKAGEGFPDWPAIRDAISANASEVAAGAPRRVRGGDERDGTDDSNWELRSAAGLSSARPKMTSGASRADFTIVQMSAALFDTPR